MFIVPQAIRTIFEGRSVECYVHTGRVIIPLFRALINKGESIKKEKKLGNMSPGE